MRQLAEKDIIEQLRRCGLRATGQRLAILRALREDTSHPSAEEIFRRLSGSFPTLSLSTVYKTLQTLAAMGVLTTIDNGTGKQRFEGQPDPHHHAVCNYCGRVIDIDFSLFPIPTPRDKMIPGFTVQSVKVYFNGVCRDCHGKKG